MDASLDWIWFGPPLEAIADEVTYERASGTKIGATNDGFVSIGAIAGVQSYRHHYCYCI